MKKTIYNCSFDKTIGYVFEKDDIKLVDKSTGQFVHMDLDPNELLQDASAAYIKNDVYTTPQTEIAEDKEIAKIIEERDKKDNGIRYDLEEVKDPKGVAAFNEQINAKEFGEYLIVIGDYAEQDFNLFTGTKKDLNAYIENLHLHSTPKVYMLKQLKVETKYAVI